MTHRQCRITLSVGCEVNLRVILLPEVLPQSFVAFHAVLQLQESLVHVQSLKDFSESEFTRLTGPFTFSLT